MGIDVSALVATLGLGGFALGFALRDAISNLLAGILILIYRPFQVGDQVKVGAAEGVVHEVNLRYTVLAGSDGTRHLIPNSMTFTTTVRVKEEGTESSEGDRETKGA
ncbi:mechanosensitive ion channel family protein [Acidobacteria bacterium AH-259-O06]|nr:mechanosensitive ion channel family protein [Acidobacteria bacterium AH-259-O06]